ncbi:porin [Shewanella sp. SR44-3]|uniref:porin n=1 Tax=Shewanella sp. SR44-3 TaxID=2760936 RepID=UPI0015FC3ECD|nr:porin [Shewanella sp. SR44-3]MBB1268696.1 porin [Shewanella sp. SR44-3]
MYRNKLLLSSLAVSIALAFSANASAEDSALAQLKAELVKLQQKVAELEAKQLQTDQAVAQNTHTVHVSNDAASTSSNTSHNKRSPQASPQAANSQIKVYTSLRPTYGYYDAQNETSWDVGDALSRVGFKASNEFMPGWQVQMHGEWNVEVANNGDFGKSRLAYVALDSPYGRLAIGKQRPPQYTLVAEYVDIFNHAGSPFGYDPEGLFFVNNLVSYELEFGDFKWMMASQFNGETGDNGSDMFNAGLGYDKGNFHAAVTYLTEPQIMNSLTLGDVDIGDNDTWAGVVAYTFDSGLYVAAAYHDKTYERVLIPSDRSGDMIDFSVGFPLSDHYGVKVGYFAFDDGDNSAASQAFDGYNATLEWLPADNIRFHIEYLTRNYDHLGDFDSVLIGMRYDFSQEWLF